MTTFEVTPKNTITPAAKRSAGSHFRFSSERQLVALAANWSNRRLVEIWNKLPRVQPVSRFTSRRTAIRRIWRFLVSQHSPLQIPPPDPPAVHPPARLPAVPPTKTQQVLTLVGRPAGATLPEIIAATGWQKHSVRGFISGQLRKRMGCRIQSFTRSGVRVYRARIGPEKPIAKTKLGAKPRLVSVRE